MGMVSPAFNLPSVYLFSEFRLGKGHDGLCKAPAMEERRK